MPPPSVKEAAAAADCAPATAAAGTAATAAGAPSSGRESCIELARDKVPPAAEPPAPTGPERALLLTTLLPMAESGTAAGVAPPTIAGACAPPSRDGADEGGMPCSMVRPMVTESEHESPDTERAVAARIVYECARLEPPTPPPPPPPPALLPLQRWWWWWWCCCCAWLGGCGGGWMWAE